MTRSSGYILQLDSADVDVARFESLASRGRQALAHGDPDTASSLLSKAMSLWRSDPLAGVARGPHLEAHRMRLEELRLTVSEQLFDASLQLGNGPSVISEIKLLTALHPFHEGLHARLMLALQQAGRRSDALQVFSELRGRLIRELGMDPSSALDQVHQSLLSTRASPVESIANWLPQAQLRVGQR